MTSRKMEETNSDRMVQKNRARVKQPERAGIQLRDSPVNSASASPYRIRRIPARPISPMQITNCSQTNTRLVMNRYLSLTVHLDR